MLASVQGQGLSAHGDPHPSEHCPSRTCRRSHSQKNVRLPILESGKTWERPGRVGQPRKHIGQLATHCGTPIHSNSTAVVFRIAVCLKALVSKLIGCLTFYRFSEVLNRSGRLWGFMYTKFCPQRTSWCRLKAKKQLTEYKLTNINIWTFRFRKAAFQKKPKKCWGNPTNWLGKAWEAKTRKPRKSWRNARNN